MAPRRWAGSVQRCGLLSGQRLLRASWTRGGAALVPYPARGRASRAARVVIRLLRRWAGRGDEADAANAARPRLGEQEAGYGQAPGQHGEEGEARQVAAREIPSARPTTSGARKVRVPPTVMMAAHMRETCSGAMRGSSMGSVISMGT